MVNQEEISEIDNRKKISIFIDFASISDVEDIKKIIEKVKDIGKVLKVRVYFLQEEFDSNKAAVEKILSMGIEPITVILAKDVKLAIDLLDDSYNDNIDLIVLGYRYENLLPALIDAKNRKTLFLVDFGNLPESLKTIADGFISI